MNKFLRLTLLSLLAIVSSNMFADTYSYTFTNSDFTAAGTKTLNGVDWTLATDATYFGFDTSTYKKGLQIGSSKKPATTISLSTSGITGTITSIKVNTAGASGITATLNVTVGGNAFGNQYTMAMESTNVEFTGSASGEIKLIYANTSAKAIYIKSVEVTYSGGLKTADLAFNGTNSCKVSIEKGSDAETNFVSPTFTYATTAPITFSTTNHGIVSVDSKGTIFLSGELGKDTVTATSEKNDVYAAGSAQCTIEVYKYNVYKKATAIESGKAYILGAILEADSVFYAYPLSTSKTYGFLSGSKYPFGPDEVKINSSYDDTFLFTVSGDNQYTIKENENGRYLYMSGTYNSFNVAEAPADAQYWTVSKNEDGTFTITNIALSKYIQYSPKYKSFGCYAEAQTDAILPVLYELDNSSTGIKVVPNTTNETVNNGAIYNPSGQRVTKNYKGLVIKNGKKYIQK
jgi:hypothetical protein